MSIVWVGAIRKNAQQDIMLKKLCLGLLALATTTLCESISRDVTTTTVIAAVSSSSSSLTVATPGTPVSPKVLLIANEFEFGYLDAYNFTTQYTGVLFDQLSI